MYACLLCIQCTSSKGNEGWREVVVVCVPVFGGRRVLNTFLIDLSLIFLRVEDTDHISSHTHHINRGLCCRDSIKSYNILPNTSSLLSAHCLFKCCPFCTLTLLYKMFSSRIMFKITFCLLFELHHSVSDCPCSQLGNFPFAHGCCYF